MTFLDFFPQSHSLSLVFPSPFLSTPPLPQNVPCSKFVFGGLSCSSSGKGLTSRIQATVADGNFRTRNPCHIFSGTALCSPPGLVLWTWFSLCAHEQARPYYDQVSSIHSSVIFVILNLRAYKWIYWVSPCNHLYILMFSEYFILIQKAEWAKH